MKLRSPKTGLLESVKIRLCDDCGRWVVDIDGEELDSMEILANEYVFVEIDRSEIADFNNFMDASRMMVQESWEFYMEKLEEADDEGNEEEGDDKSRFN